MIRRPPRSTRTYTLFPYPTLFRSLAVRALERPAVDEHDRLHGGHAVVVAPRGLGPQRPGGGRALCPPRPDRPRSAGPDPPARRLRSEEHTSELQSLMRISYDGFCLKKKNKK